MQRSMGRRRVPSRVRSCVVAGVLAASAVTIGAPVGPPVGVAEAAPPGFVDELVGTVDQATTVNHLFGGLTAVLGQHGTVHLIRGGQLLPTPALTLPNVCTTGFEDGLSGIAGRADSRAGSGSGGDVFVFYTRVAPGANARNCVNRVSRFRIAGDVIDPASEVVLLDDLDAVGGQHHAGDLEIGKDGMLWIAVGDGGADPRGDSGDDSGTIGRNDAPQDLSLLNGKILRVDPDTGAPAPGNPYSGPWTAACGRRGNTAATPISICQEIWAYGFRNPYRFAFDPNSPGVRVFVNDVGQKGYEEVNELVAGGNYGWPVREGGCPQGSTPPCAADPRFVEPIVWYGPDRGTYITGGAFVPADDRWPAEFAGGYVFVDGGSGSFWLRRADGSVDLGAPFHTNHGVVDVEFVSQSDGLWLYAVEFGSGEVRRLGLRTQAPPTSSDPMRYVPLDAARRVFDSRRPADGAARLTGNVARTLSLGIDGSSARAALVNLTYVQPARNGFLVAWSAGGAMPATSNVNASAGEVTANAAVVPVDAQGRLQLLTNADAHVLVDLLGWFESAPGPVSAGRVIPLQPQRLLDTRFGSAGPFTRRDAPPVNVVSTPVLGRGGVPVSGVAAVVITLTAVADTTSGGRGFGGGWVAVSAGGAPLPPISITNTRAGSDVRANLAVVPIGADGTIDLHLFGVPHVVVDVTGYVTDASAQPSTSGRFHVFERAYREVDTRLGAPFERWDRMGTRVLAPMTPPVNATAVLQTVTVVGNAAPGYVVATPGGSSGGTSTVNASAPGQIRAAAALTARASNGWLGFDAIMATDVVVDVAGWVEGT